MEKKQKSGDNREFVGGTNEFARLVPNQDKAGKVDAVGKQVSLVKPEDVYANPNILDRAAYNKLFTTENFDLWYQKTDIETVELNLDRLIYAYDAETEKPLMNEWHKPGYDLQQQLDTRRCAFMEFGGPTYSGFTIIEGLNMPQKIHVTNIYEGYSRYTDDGVDLVG